MASPSQGGGAVLTLDWGERKAEKAKAVAAKSQLQQETDVPITASSSAEVSSEVLAQYESALGDESDCAVAVAAINALTAMIQRSESATMMGLERELKQVTEAIKARHPSNAIPTSAACELFLRYVSRTSALEFADVQTAKQHLIERGSQFREISLQARARIAATGAHFIRDDSIILLHGFSRVSLAILRQAASEGKKFKVVSTEGRPNGSGAQVADELGRDGIPVKLALDNAVAVEMESCSMVLVGAEGVVESGGVINNAGTYQVALVANALGKPVYVAAESYKFTRMFPLTQHDLPVAEEEVTFQSNSTQELRSRCQLRDYCPPGYITLLFTELGVLTPAAVSDELIQLYT